jgi:phage-related minor tail protein
MADRIKGITVEIGGDTTKLSDALKNVNKYIRETQDQLLDVNNLLKLDPVMPIFSSRSRNISPRRSPIQLK